MPKPNNALLKHLLPPKASHGTARPGTHPFTIELLTEYTDVAVGAWRPGVNYDLKLSTPSKVDSGIGGFLVLVSCCAVRG